VEDKQCPYCGQTLIKGNVNAPQENFLFLPEGLSMLYFRTRWVKVEGSTIIRKFQVLKEKGALNEEEFQEAKKIILEQYK
jgi:hypothetical protein